MIIASLLRAHWLADGPVPPMYGSEVLHLIIAPCQRSVDILQCIPNTLKMHTLLSWGSAISTCPILPIADYKPVEACHSFEKHATSTYKNEPST